MALSKLLTALNIIGQLGTTVQERGLMTQEFKDKFDEAVLIIQEYLNDTLIAEFASTTVGKGASCIGVQDSAGLFAATTVEAILAEIAGTGRTTETLKSLADLISTHTADKLTAHNPENIIAPSLLNSWVNFGTGYSSAGYWKDSMKMVHIKGMIKSGTSGTVAFTLPVGYRPSETQNFAVNSYGAFGYVTINSAGNVTVNGNTLGLNLDGISFRAEA